MASMYGTGWPNGQHLVQAGQMASMYGTGWSGDQYLGQHVQVVSMSGTFWSDGQYLWNILVRWPVSMEHSGQMASI